ncbi:hypothetical protein GCM10028778_21430 [Barrientosiimonas marina]|uniref:DUF4190 domain-containing protein n=1 Tax=Lentibacillus kimchii TaxID=1542911 RepID=A0ABW2USP6_9BACI
MDLETKLNGKSVIILVLGILSVLIEEWLGLIVGIAGIVLYIEAKNHMLQHQMPSRGVALAGVILSVVGTLIQFLDIID